MDSSTTAKTVPVHSTGIPPVRRATRSRNASSASMLRWRDKGRVFEFAVCQCSGGFAAEVTSHWQQFNFTSRLVSRQPIHWLLTASFTR